MRLLSKSELLKNRFGEVGDGERTHFRSNVYRDTEFRKSASIDWAVCDASGTAIVVNCVSFRSGTNAGNDDSISKIDPFDFASDNSANSRSSSLLEAADGFAWTALSSTAIPVKFDAIGVWKTSKENHLV